jgi:hypothetical protein
MVTRIKHKALSTFQAEGRKIIAPGEGAFFAFFAP